MKEGIGYTLTLNIATIFIVIIFTFLSNIVIYYKGYKVSNMITSSIEKYEGFNELSYNEIELKLTSIGYNKHKISCAVGDTDEHTAVKIQGNVCFFMRTFDDVFDEYVIHFDSKYHGGTLNSSIARELSRNSKASTLDYEPGNSGYCIYKCSKKLYDKISGLNDYEYYYVVKTNMFANIPILNSILNYSVYTDTNVMYDFEEAIGTSD